MHVLIEDGQELRAEVFRGQTFMFHVASARAYDTAGDFLYRGRIGQFSVHRAIVDRSLMNKRCPDNTGCAHVELSATS